MATATSTNNKTLLIQGGKPFFDLLIKLIQQATENIYLQTYIFSDDETGKAVATALMEAASRKVKVYLLADGYASQSLPGSFIRELKASGIQFRFFEPLFKSKQFYFGRRLHHKVFVADTRYALVGGINIANRYNDLPGKPAWLDFALFAEGDIARELCILCRKTWSDFPAKPDIAACTQKELPVLMPQNEKCRVIMKRNDWVRRKNEISGTYINMFRHSRSHITILCSYFLPGKVVRRLLRNASKRGVKIKVVTAGPSDILVAKYAERWMYDWLLRNNIELYEYQPAVLHAKLSVCDGEWLTVGSYNINNISAYASIELNLDVYNARLAAETEAILENIISRNCIRITKSYHASTKNIFRQFVRWCSYEFIRFVFYLFTFYFRQTKSKHKIHH